MKMHEIDEGFVDSVKHGFKKYNDRDAVVSPFTAGLKDAGEKDKDKDQKKKTKAKTEMTAGDVASSMGGGNGFVGGGVGTIKRAPGSKKKKNAVKR